MGMTHGRAIEILTNIHKRGARALDDTLMMDVRAALQLAGQALEEHREASLQLRRLRRVEWWATYRAALTGIYAYSAPGESFSTEGGDKQARDAADLAHGPLDGEP